MSRKAIIIAGGWEGHEPIKVAELFKEMLEKHNFRVEISQTLESYSDADNLKKYDLIVPCWTMAQLPDGYEKNISEALSNGTGMAGCHGGMCDSFRSNTEWQFMTGAQWVSHPGGIFEYKVNIKKSSSSPVIQGAEDFVIKSEQYYLHIDPAVEVLATTKFEVTSEPHSANGAVDMPVIFTKKWGKGRIFYFSIGHTAKDFENESAKKLMENGMLWAAGII